MSQLTIRMTDGREVTGRTVLMDQRGYAKFARVNNELPVDQDAGTFSLYMSWQFYKRITGDDAITFDDFCLSAEELEGVEDAADPTSATT